MKWWSGAGPQGARDGGFGMGLCISDGLIVLLISPSAVHSSSCGFNYSLEALECRGLSKHGSEGPNREAFPQKNQAFLALI